MESNTTVDDKMEDTLDDKMEDTLDDKMKDTRYIKFIQRCINSLEHACECQNSNCPIASCIKVKVVVIHAQICQQDKGKCAACNHLLTMCSYHAKQCQLMKCSVPFCHNYQQSFGGQKETSFRVEPSSKMAHGISGEERAQHGGNWQPWL